ncbi:hypothetical protein [Streptomyces massasporeus]
MSEHDLDSPAKRPVSDGRHVDLRWVIASPHRAGVISRDSG